MDWKLASAFATGAVMASLIVFFAMKPEPVATKPVPRQPPKMALRPPPPVAHVQPPVHRTLVREKPSPMPPPVRRERPVTVARYQPPPPLLPPPATLPLHPPATLSIPPAQPAPAPKVEVRVPNVVTLTAGMTLAVRIGETVSSVRNQPGDSFLATLTQPLVIDGFVIAERGARVEGRVLDAIPAGRGRVSHLAVSVVQVATSDGQNIRIRTEPYSKDGAIPAAEIPVETRINFRVQDSVTITEHLD